MELGWFFVIGAIIVLGIFLYLNKLGESLEANVHRTINNYYEKYEFNPSKSHNFLMWTEGIAYDHEQNKFLYFKNICNKNEKVELIEPSSIMEARLIENGETVTRTSRTSQVVGATVGSLIAGGIGAIIGGLSGKHYSDKKIKELKLELIVDNPLDPIRRITFMYDASGMKQNSSKYKEVYEQAYYWLKLVEVAIN